MITIKNSELNNDAVQALNNLIEMDIKSTTAFRLMRIIKEISSLVDDKLKAEKKILDKHVEKDLNGQPLPVFDENNQLIESAVKIKDMKLFQIEMEELLIMDNELNSNKINFDDLGLDTVKIKDILKIDFIFE